MNQYDEAVHSNAHPQVTYDFPPDPDVTAAAMTNGSSTQTTTTTTAILQQLTDLSKTNTDRLNAQEGASKTLTTTVGDLAAQVRSNHEASAAQNQANAESIRSNREASIANAKSIRANAESIRANREASAANAMQIKNMHEQLSSAMNGIKKNASDIVVINDQLDKVQTDVGEISIKLDSVTNDTIVYKESFQTVFGGMRKIVDVLQTPCAKDRDAKVKALHIDTFASQDLATPTATPTNQPGQIFTFGNGDINPSPTSSPAGSKPCAIQERLPDAITSVFAFGRVPDHSTHPYNFSGPLKTCLEDHPEDTPHIFMVGCDMISKPENAPFEVKSDADVQVPSLGVIFSPSVPTLHVGKEWMEQGITMKEIIGFDNDEFRLEWAERTFLGRTVKVLVAADGFPDEDTMNKLTLLVARPSVVEKQKVPKSGEGKVMYRMVSRDEVGEVRMNEDGSIRYASQVAEELRFTKDEMDDDLEWYIEEGKLDPVDREAVRLSALVRCPVLSCLFVFGFSLEPCFSSRSHFEYYSPHRRWTWL